MKDTLWYVPYSKVIDRFHVGCFRARRKDAEKAFVKTAFGGQKDWAYCKRMGWRIICVRVTTNLWAPPPDSDGKADDMGE